MVARLDAEEDPSPVASLLDFLGSHIFATHGIIPQMSVCESTSVIWSESEQRSMESWCITRCCQA